MLTTSKIAKKLVNSDYKNKRVQDPTKISSKQEKQVKKYVKDFFDKAVAKREQHDRKKAERRAKDGKASETMTPQNNDAKLELYEEEEEVKADLTSMDREEDMESEDGNDRCKQDSSQEEEFKDGESPSDLKRKRDVETPPADHYSEIDFTTPKKIKSETETPPPPPPPPPPEDTRNGLLANDIEQRYLEEKVDMIEREQVQTSLSVEDEDISMRASKTAHAKSLADKSNGETQYYLKQKINGINCMPSPVQLATPPVNGAFDLENSDDQTKHVDGRQAAQEVTVADS